MDILRLKTEKKLIFYLLNHFFVSVTLKNWNQILTRHEFNICMCALLRQYWVIFFFFFFYSNFFSLIWIWKTTWRLHSVYGETLTIICCATSNHVIWNGILKEIWVRKFSIWQRAFLLIFHAVLFWVVGVIFQIYFLFYESERSFWKIYHRKLKITFWFIGEDLWWNIVKAM